MKSFLICPICALFVALNSDAATIFESGTLGQTGITWVELQNQTVPGTNVNSAVFAGVRFELSDRIITSQVGGHFVGQFPGTFFGAIVALDDANDFPNSDDLSTPDVLGKAILAFPNPSTEVFGNLNLSLDPGWYALVFGSGLFGTTGSGGAVRNGADIADPSYIGFGPNLHWFNFDIYGSFFDNHRFVVNGSVVPEANTFVSILVMVVTLSSLRIK